MRHIILLFLMSILPAALSFSQGNDNNFQDDTLNYRLPFEVNVSAPRVQIPLRLNPSATSIVGQEVLGSMPRSIAIDEALRFVPGLRIDNQADGERVHISIRGQGILTERGIRGIKVLLDGLPLNDPSGFAPDFYDVDWANVEKVEVLRGPAAALYGGGATAGVINIITKKGTESPLGMEAYAAAGSFNFWKTFLRAGGTYGDLNFNISASRMMGDGYREHTRYNATNVYGKMDWNPAVYIRLSPIIAWSGFFNENAEGLNSTWMAEDRRMANPDALKFNEYQETGRFSGGIVGEIYISHSRQIQFNGFFRRTLYKEPVPSSVQHRAMESPGFSIQYNMHSESGDYRNNLSFGADLQQQIIDEYRKPNLGDAVEGGEYLSDQKIEQKGLGFFLLDRIELGQRWGLMLSLRYDRVVNSLTDNLRLNGVDLSGSADFRKTTGRVGVTYSPVPSLNIYANWGQGFLPPSTEELVNNPAGQGGFNTGLVSATSYGEEAGIRGTIGRDFIYDMDIFYLNTDKDFDRYRITSRPLETFYRNLGSSRRFGLETYLEFRPLRSVNARVSYTYSNFKYTTDNVTDGNTLPNSPVHQAYIEVAYNLIKDISLALSSEVQSRWYINTENSASIGGFTLYHARLSYMLNLNGFKGEFSLFMRNIFSREYIAFSEPDPDGNSYQPGPLSEISGSLRIGL
ncbi:MAG: TonB-dependent receptor family protein [Ignavibacteriales bacterium]